MNRRDFFKSLALVGTSLALSAQLVEAFEEPERRLTNKVFAPEGQRLIRIQVANAAATQSEMVYFSLVRGDAVLQSYYWNMLLPLEIIFPEYVSEYGPIATKDNPISIVTDGEGAGILVVQDILREDRPYQKQPGALHHYPFILGRKNQQTKLLLSHQLSLETSHVQP